MTQVNPNGSTCPATQLSPPSCLWQFTGVSESAGFDAGHVYRFENGSPWPNSDKCVTPDPIPTNNYAQYQANGTLVADDPRVITVFVVPDGSLTSTTHLVPIVGYATFYLEGWDHEYRTRTAARARPAMHARSERLQPLVVETRRGVEQFSASARRWPASS